jgi:hypothetical protein
MIVRLFLCLAWTLQLEPPGHEVYMSFICSVMSVKKTAVQNIQLYHYLYPGGGPLWETSAHRGSGT